MRLIIALFSLALSYPALAEGERAGAFDYYVLSLSWSPNWCLNEGDARDSPQCDARHDFGFTLHGLWPQFNQGYPSYCPTSHSAPSRSQTRGMADVMGTSGLAWHQWRKHGVCTGLSPKDYYALSRKAYAVVTRPEIFRKLTQDIALPAAVVEEAFMEANPEMDADGVTITCKNRRIQEARICLDKELNLITCGPGVRRDCALTDAGMSPVR